MITCLADVLRPSVGKSVVSILRRLGHSVDFPENQTCCGQPMFNSGFADLSRRQAQHTIRVFEPCDVVVTPSGSCAAMVKVEYPQLLTSDPEWSKRALVLAAKTFEFSDFVVNRLEIVNLGAKYAGRIAYHFACHLRMLGQVTEAETLIRHVDGAELVELRHQEQCCGFGGSFSVRYPKISTAMVDDKVNCLHETSADAVVSTDSGCLMNIGGRLRRLGRELEVLHLAELLDRR